MSNQKRPVRLMTATVKNPQTGRVELQVRATTKMGNKTLFAQGDDEKAALARLREKVAEAAGRAEFRERYPKTIEVDW